MLLTLVLLLLLVLGAVGNAMGLFGSSVSTLTRRTAMGDVATDLAAVALTEAHFRMARSAAEPGYGSFFDLFRRTEGAGAFAVAIGELPATAEIFAARPQFELVDGMVEGKVLFQRPSSSSNPSNDDRFGMVELSATVRHHDTGVRRRLRQCFDVKTSLVAPPRPLDGWSLCLARPRPFIDACSADGDVNVTIERSLERLDTMHGVLNRVARSFRDLLAEIKGKEGASQIEPKARRLLALVEQALRNHPDIRLGQGDTRNAPTTLHLFPKGDFALVTTASQIALSDVNLPVKIRNRCGQVVALDEAQARAFVAFSNSMQADRPDFATVERLLRAWLAALELCTDGFRALLIDDIKAFQDFFRSIEGADYGALRPVWQTFTVKEWARRATSIIHDGNPDDTSDRRDLAGRFAGLMDRGSAHSGVCLVVNRQQELVIDRQFRGHLVLVATGAVTIRRALVEDPARDTVVIVCLGRVAVEGPVQASLVAASALLMEDQTFITGNLVVLNPDLGAAPPERILAGTVTYDVALQAGAPARQYVNMGPVPVVTDGERL